MQTRWHFRKTQPVHTHAPEKSSRDSVLLRPGPTSESGFDVESFIHEYYEAWGGTDLDLIMSYYAENVVLQIPGLLMEGKGAVRDQFAVPFTTAFPGNRHIVKNLIFGSGVVNVEFSFEAQHAGPFAGHAATGAQVKLPGCGVYEYDSAKRQITAARIYFDVGTLLQTITDSLLGARKKAEEASQTNERNLSLITNVIPTFIQVLRTDGSVLYVNQAVLGYTGLTLEDVRKEDYCARVFHPEDAERLREERNQALTRPVSFENEQRLLGKDGKYRWFLTRYNPLLDQRGKIDRWYVAATDIDDRKRAEEAQARQAGVRADVSAAFSRPNRLGEILRGCTEAIVRHLGAAFARIWVLSKDESMLELQASAGMYTRLDGSYSRIPVGDLKVGLIAREKKAHFTNEVMNDPRVNDKAWAQSNGMVAFAGYPLVVEDRLIGVVALFARCPLADSILDTLASVADTIAQGIERKRAEDELRASEQKYRRLVDTTPAFVHTALPTGELDFLNRGWLKYVGAPLTDLLGWRWTSVIHPEDVEAFVDKWHGCVQSGEPFLAESRVRRADGEYRWFLHHKEPLRNELGEIVKWYGSSIEIEERKIAEKAIRHSEAYLAEAQRLSHTGTSAHNPATGKLHYWSEETYRIWGFDPQQSPPDSSMIFQRVHPEDRDRARQEHLNAMDERKGYDQEFRIVRSDGAVRHVHIVGHPVFSASGELIEYVTTHIDVTENKLAEHAIRSSEAALQETRAELERVTRVTTMGELAASIAHEINQPLAGVVTSANAGLNWLANQPPNLLKTREAIERILRDGTRAGEVLTRIRALIKRTAPAKSPMNVNQVIRDVVVLTGGELRQKNVELSVELDSTLPELQGDEIQLQQVFLNLIKNAIEAMDNIGDRRKILLIRSELGQLEHRPAISAQISDTGVGIDSPNSDGLFQAFYTTKPEGMGMGLWISRSIIEAHGGRLSALNNDGSGATFQVVLPVDC